jgi:TatD DNase family protein
LEKFVQNPKVVAIGECGLDYFKIKDESEKILQKNLFESQIQFAIKHDKPLMLHVREAYSDAISVLENYKKEAGEKLRGNVHFFVGDVAVAKKFLDLGFVMSFTGVITFTRDYDEVIKYIPQNSIMSETDAPFVAPVPFRGRRNEPVFVIEVVKKMAEIRGESEKALNMAILENFRRVFGV